MPLEPITRLNIIKPKRTCKHCEIEKDLTDYYTNTKWEDKLSKDVWCKDCVKGLNSKEEVRQYFWENNRKWDEKIWTDAKAAAEKDVLNNAVYKKADVDQKKIMLERLACQQVSMLMNKPAYYSYDDHLGTNYEEAKSSNLVTELEDDETLRQYDLDWNGYYTQKELTFLNNFYNKMIEGREDLDFAQEVYIRNWAKAAMNLDKAHDALLRGEGSYEDVQKASAVMDMVGKTGQLAPKKKEEKAEAMNSVAEISLYLIQHGHPMVRQIDWPKDKVDEVMAEFGYLPVALGLQDLN